MEAAQPQLKRAKRRFSPDEKYGVYMAHEKKCGRCGTPLPYLASTIDHFFPESLLDEPKRFEVIARQYQLPVWFDINGFENWRPLCWPCNTKKGQKVPRWTEGHQEIVDLLLRRRDDAQARSEAMKAATSGGRDKALLLSALEGKRLSVRDLLDLVRDITQDPESLGLPDGAIVLDDGLLYLPDEVAARHICRCERERCVGHESKVLCTFPRSLSPWAITSGLYHACYDEEIVCPRCGEDHRRGDVGRSGACGRPFADQAQRSD